MGFPNERSSARRTALGPPDGPQPAGLPSARGPPEIGAALHSQLGAWGDRPPGPLLSSALSLQPSASLVPALPASCCYSQIRSPIAAPGSRPFHAGDGPVSAHPEPPAARLPGPSALLAAVVAIIAISSLQMLDTRTLSQPAPCPCPPFTPPPALIREAARCLFRKCCVGSPLDSCTPLVIILVEAFGFHSAGFY